MLIDLKIIGKRIQKLRLDNELTKIQLAVALNTTEEKIIEMEDGQGITSELVVEAALFFGVSSIELVKGSMA